MPFDHNAKRLKTADFPPSYYTTDAFSAHAARLICQAATSDRPFFISLCYNAPHSPLHALPEDIARYPGKYRDGYFRLRERRFKRQLELGLFDPAVTALSAADPKTNAFKHDYAIPAWDRLDASQRSREEERMEVYAAMVDRLDQGIGTVLAALEESGLARNTVVFFMSDNGGAAAGVDPQDEVPRNARPIGPAEGNEKVGPGWGRHSARRFGATRAGFMKEAFARR